MPYPALTRDGTACRGFSGLCCELPRAATESRDLPPLSGPDGVVLAAAAVQGISHLYSSSLIQVCACAQRGAVPPLIAMLGQGDVQLKEMAAFALGRLAQNADNQAGIVQVTVVCKTILSNAATAEVQSRL